MRTTTNPGHQLPVAGIEVVELQQRIASAGMALALTRQGHCDPRDLTRNLQDLQAVLANFLKEQHQ